MLPEGLAARFTPASAVQKLAGVAEVAGVPPVRRASSSANAPPCGVDRKTVAQLRSASLGNFPSEKRLHCTKHSTMAKMRPQFQHCAESGERIRSAFEEWRS